MVFAQHPTVPRGSRPGRAFMRAEASATAERYRNQQRTLRIAELLFNLQGIEGIDGRLEELRAGNVESTYAELEAGSFLFRRALSFRYVDPSGVKGSDYDAEIRLPEGTKVNCEMKCKAEITGLGEAAVRNPLEHSRKQLPAGEPGLVFFKLPEAWVSQPEIARVVPTAVDGFLRCTSRVVAVILGWEEQYLQGADGRAVVLYKFRLERGTPTKPTAPPVDEMLTILAGPARAAPWVWFRSIAEEAMCE